MKKEWLEHPITAELKEELKKRIQELKDDWANMNFFKSPDEELIALGALKTYRDVLEAISEEEHDAGTTRV